MTGGLLERRRGDRRMVTEGGGEGAERNSNWGLYLIARKGER